MPERRWTHIRVPIELARRIDDLAVAMQTAYSEGRLSLPTAICERVPQWYAIQAALDEQQARRVRSNRPRTAKQPQS